MPDQLSRSDYELPEPPPPTGPTLETEEGLTGGGRMDENISVGVDFNKFDDRYVRDKSTGGSTAELDRQWLLLNKDHTGSPNDDVGLEVERGDSVNAFLYWREGEDAWSARLGAGGTPDSLVLEDGNRWGIDVQDALTLGGIAASNYARTDIAETFEEDITVDKQVTSKQGIVGDSFNVSTLGGSGYVLRKLGDGSTQLYSDEIVANTFRVAEFLVNQTTFSESKAISAGVVARDPVDNGDGTHTFDTDTTPTVAVDDLLRAKRYTDGSHDSKVRVTSVDTANKTVTVELLSGDVPGDGFQYARIGNTSDTARQNLIYLTASDASNPRVDFYEGISQFSEFGASTLTTRLGNLSGLSKAESSKIGLYTEVLRATDDLIVGSLDKTGQYLAYDGSTLDVVTETFSLSANNISIESEGPNAGEARISMKSSSTGYDPVIIDRSEENFSALDTEYSEGRSDISETDPSRDLVSDTADYSGTSGFSSDGNLRYWGDFQISGSAPGSSILLQFTVWFQQNISGGSVLARQEFEKLVTVDSNGNFSWSGSFDLSAGRVGTDQVRYWHEVTGEIGSADTYTIDLTNRQVAQYHPQTIVNEDGVFVKHSPTYTAVLGGAGGMSVAGSGGAVSSVFGRTGAITAQDSDYTHDQIAGISSDDHHTRPSAGDGLTENSNSFDVDSTVARTDQDETFTKDVTIQQNLYIEGSEVIANTETLDIQDNLQVLNAGESNAGITKGMAGIEYDRGTNAPVRVIYDEGDGWHRVGKYYKTLNYTNLSGTFDVNEKIVGQTSGAEAFVWNDDGAGTMSVKRRTGSFDVAGGEQIVGQTSGASADLTGRSTTDDTQAVATRQDSPTDRMVMIWDNVNNRVVGSDIRGAMYVDFANNERSDYDVDGRLYWDKSEGLYIKSSNSLNANPALLWSSGNVKTGDHIGVTYGTNDRPTISLDDEVAIRTENETVSGQWTFDSLIQFINLANDEEMIWGGGGALRTLYDANSPRVRINTDANDNANSKVDFTAGSSMDLYARIAQGAADTHFEANVGIGTQSPLADLHVSGSEELRLGGQNSDGHVIIQTFAGGSGAGQFQVNTIDGTGSGSPIYQFLVEGTEALFINQGRQVGINTRPDERLDVDGTIGHGYTSGILGSGYIIDPDAGGGTFIEADNMRIRNEFRTHIFRKDVVKAANGYLLITDSSEAAESKSLAASGNTDTIKFKDGNGMATFSSGNLVWIKSISNDGATISGIKFTIDGVNTTGSTNGTSWTEYNITVESSGTVKEQDTGVRVSGGYILNDASTTNSPFVDVYDGVSTWSDFQSSDKLKARYGNLSGAPNLSDGTTTSGYGLWSENVFLEGAIVSSTGEIGAWEINAENLNANNGDNAYIYLQAKGATAPSNSIDYPTISLYRNANDGADVRASMGLMWTGSYTDEFGFALHPNNGAAPYLQFTKNISTGSLTAEIAGWEFTDKMFKHDLSSGGQAEIRILDSDRARFAVTPDGDFSGGTGNFIFMEGRGPNSTGTDSEYRFVCSKNGNKIVELGSEDNFIDNGLTIRGGAVVETGALVVGVEDWSENPYSGWSDRPYNKTLGFVVDDVNGILHLGVLNGRKSDGTQDTSGASYEIHVYVEDSRSETQATVNSTDSNTDSSEFDGGGDNLTHHTSTHAEYSGSHASGSDDAEVHLDNFSKRHTRLRIEVRQWTVDSGLNYGIHTGDRMIERGAVGDGSSSDPARISSSNPFEVTYDAQGTVISHGNVTTNAVTANEIEAETITTNELAANAVTADKIQVDSLGAVSATLGTVTINENVTMPYSDTRGSIVIEGENADEFFVGAYDVATAQQESTTLFSTDLTASSLGDGMQTAQDSDSYNFTNKVDEWTIRASHTFDASPGDDFGEYALVKVTVELYDSNNSFLVDASDSRSYGGGDSGVSGEPIEVSLTAPAGTDWVKVIRYVEVVEDDGSAQSSATHWSPTDIKASSGNDFVGPKGMVHRESGTVQTIVNGGQSGGLKSTEPGDFWANGSYMTSSDLRGKENPTPVETPLDILRDIQGITYTERGQLKGGVGAQDLIGTFEPALFGSEEEGYSVAYNMLFAPVLEGMTVLDDRTVDYEQRIAELEAENEALRKRVRELEE